MFAKIIAQSAKRIAVTMSLVTFSLLSATTPTFVRADSYIQNTIVPLTGFEVYISCAAQGMGESVILDGYLHVVEHRTINGNKLITKYHIQPQQVSGVGLTTGLKYQGNGVTQGITHSSVDGWPYTYTFVNNFRIIGQGSGNNVLTHQLVHMTINANGETTAYVDSFSTECK